MNIGKISSEELARILSYLPLSGKPGLDSNTLDNLVVSQNPAIGVPTEYLGFFAYHYAASNIAVSLAKPEYALLEVLVPPDFQLEELEKIFEAFGREAKKYNTLVVGGHTGRYKGLNLPLASVTVFGRKVREKVPPKVGDRIVLIGVIGLEAAWLLGEEIEVKDLTPLPAALSLQELSCIKFMHDISEGGLLASLLDISRVYNVRINISQKEIPVYPHIPGDYDPLVLPSYGSIVAVIPEDSEVELEAFCRDREIEHHIIGEVTGIGYGVYVEDRGLFRSPERSIIDYLYGEESLGDRFLSELYATALHIASMDRFIELVPEVGSNIVYAKPDASNVEDIAAIDGRIVRTSSKARVCGKARYGASRYLAPLLLEAIRNGSGYRVAINIRGSREVLEAARRAGIKVAVVDVKGTHICPLAGVVGKIKAEAYFHPGDIGVEPLIVIFAKSLPELAAKIKSILKALR